MKALAACPLCQSRAWRVILAEGTRRLTECSGCGLIVRNPQPSREEVGAFYGHDYFVGLERDSIGYSGYVDLRDQLRDEAKVRLNFLKELLPELSPGTLLDVGCATGDFLEVARERGWRTQGVELAAFAADNARNKGLDVILGTLNDVGGENRFDLITLLDVIEHLSDPLIDLMTCHRLLRTGGYLAINTPNATSLHRWLAGGKWWGFQQSAEHLFYFSRKTLAAFLERAGFSVILNTTFYTDWPPFQHIVNVLFPSLKKRPYILRLDRPKIAEVIERPLEWIGAGHVIFCVARRR
jgi:SAM-dependent methyltransferase